MGHQIVRQRSLRRDVPEAGDQRSRFDRPDPYRHEAVGFFVDENDHVAIIRDGDDVPYGDLGHGGGALGLSDYLATGSNR